MRANRGRLLLSALGVLGAAALAMLSAAVFARGSAHGPTVDVEETVEVGYYPTSACAGAREYDCYQERYEVLVRDSGAQSALTALKADQARFRLARLKCHELAHAIGRAAAEQYGGVAAAYDQGANFCMAGYYHGVIEAIVAKVGRDKIRIEPGSVCSHLGTHQEDPVYRGECAHVVGHGLMVLLKNELFEALLACDRFGRLRDQRECHSGVFMENAVAGRLAHDDASHPSRYLDSDKPLYPCTIVAARYKNRCYRYQTIYALTTQGNDFGKVFALCAAAEEGYRVSCYASLGRDASADGISRFATITGQANQTRLLCMLGRDYEARSNCILSAVRGMISWYRSDAQAKVLCRLLRADLGTLCLREAEDVSKQLRPASSPARKL